MASRGTWRPTLPPPSKTKEQMCHSKTYKFITIFIFSKIFSISSACVKVIKHQPPPKKSVSPLFWIRLKV